MPVVFKTAYVRNRSMQKTLHCSLRFVKVHLDGVWQHVTWSGALHPLTPGPARLLERPPQQPHPPQTPRLAQDRQRRLLWRRTWSSPSRQTGLQSEKPCSARHEWFISLSSRLTQAVLCLG